MSETRRMTDDEIVAIVLSDGHLNAARSEFTRACAEIEQALAQREQPSPIEIRRMEIRAVFRMAAALGIDVREKFGIPHQWTPPLVATGRWVTSEPWEWFIAEVSGMRHYEKISKEKLAAGTIDLRREIELCAFRSIGEAIYRLWKEETEATGRVTPLPEAMSATGGPP